MGAKSGLNIQNEGTQWEMPSMSQFFSDLLKLQKLAEFKGCFFSVDSIVEEEAWLLFPYTFGECKWFMHSSLCS